MRKIIITLSLLATMLTPASAQDVLNEIVKTSQAIVNDTTQSMEVRKTAVFKYDALTYLRSKLLPPSAVLSDNVDLKKFNELIRTLNEQALAMNQYVTLYEKRLKEAKKKNKDVVMKLFKMATKDHPYFQDDDTEVTMAYYNREDYPVQFCLDCNWVKTLEFIRTIDWSGL